MSIGRTAGIYARISLDRRDGEGVARQLADCRKLVTERGWTHGGEYIDNDLSAFRAKRRPEWQRLLHDLDTGIITAVVAYHPDRTYRQARDLEELIDIVERTGAEIATVRAGDVDLATATGRMGARIVAAVSRHESERIGERVSRAKRERATQGRPPGGGYRAFGYADDKITLIPDEARAIRGAARRVAAGGSVGQEVRRLNAAGFTTTAGKPWDTAALRRVLISPRIAGLRAYKGEIVGPAVWSPIIDEDTWHRLVVMVQGRRRGPATASDTLLSALIACPHCGMHLYSDKKRDYKCAPSSRQGCGRSSIAIGQADRAVTQVIDDYLNDPDVPRWIAAASRQQVDLSTEVAAIEAKQVELARRWALDELTTDAYDQARILLTRRMAALGDITPTPVEAPDLERLRAAWRSTSVQVRRGVVQALVVTPIELLAGRMKNPADRLKVRLRDD